MSKQCQKENKKRPVLNNSAENAKSEQKPAINFFIGVSNVKRWNKLKCLFSCKSNEDFVTVLLDLAENHVTRNNTNEEVSTNENGYHIETNTNTPSPNGLSEQNLSIQNERNYVNLSVKVSGGEVVSYENKFFTENLVTEQEELTQLKELNYKNDLRSESLKEEVFEEPLIQETPNDTPVKIKTSKLKKKDSDKSKKCKVAIKCEKVKKKVDVDIRKAPEFNVQEVSPLLDNLNNVSTTIKKENEEEQIDTKSQTTCSVCFTKHVLENCPFESPVCTLPDSISIDTWKETYGCMQQEEFKVDNQQNESPESDLNSDIDFKSTFAFLSLPQSLCYQETNTDHGLGVYTRDDIQQFTQFGPIVGKQIKEVDVPEDCNMRDLWEITTMDKTCIYLNTDDLHSSNWLRFIRPAPSRELRNLCAISKNDNIYLYSVRDIKSGEELLYWQDGVVISHKKKIEKTNCGGCNMNFGHIIYYRVHCLIFHDIRYSLTIRKYHCKVCGAAVLGKENIMKHASELHNGEGAYQCQFCKKFFLRLNYLEMHRTYGCSANPHRSRPLCDFCGRKFCQPQKLKVHIKRMHSDMSEVLKEFQCKNCMKILGSRAALQRHLKEVHQKQVDGACACSKCGKMFQNKSNLKIHMLTHSGIKPFKCVEKECSAAFTTKQCLQFHYKKVHGLVEEQMPKIERTVDYTFEAYSGADDPPNDGEEIQQPARRNNKRFRSSSECDDTSLDERNIDNPPSVQSPPLPQSNENSSSSNQSQPAIESYPTPTMKMLTKGSKKWIGTDLDMLKTDIYQVDRQKHKPEELNTIVLDIEQSQQYDHTKLNSNLSSFGRQESSNASLLVEAALDSVCSEPNIDIDVNSTTNCADALVNNLYTLSHTDALPDVPYSNSADMTESRDINLISPSVNDHISVTDDLNDELRHAENLRIDYTSFHQDDFSPPNSPNIQNRTFERVYITSPQNNQNYDNLSKTVSPANSPPRYDFGHNINTDHISSDDSNGIGVQNLSIHSKENSQLDLSLYKSHYTLDNFQFRKDFRHKIEENDRKQLYLIGLDGTPKSYDEMHKFNVPDTELDLQTRSLNESIDQDKHKDLERSNLDMRKFELDLDLRKSYENVEGDMRTRNMYDNTVDEFRIKNYDLVDSLESRNSLEGRNLLETDFRPDRSFDHLVLNSAELQGLDMTARSYHNYSNLNRYHHLYSDVDRSTVDLRLNYNSPSQNYTHADILRVVSLDLTPPGRHSVDLSLRSHQISNTRLLSDHTIQSNHRLSLDQSRLLTSDLNSTRHINTDSRLLTVSDMSNRILSDHSTTRLLTNDTSRLLGAEQRLLTDDSRLISEQPRLLEQSRILTDTRILPPNSGSISPVPYAGYSVSPTPYHPTALPPRPHVTSPTPPYHHYSTYY